MRLAAGTRLGPYEIVSAIGAGGMGEVYKARDTRLDRAVAVKILSHDIAGSAEARQRFEREARTISQISHPHICAVYDVGLHDGIDYLVMELLEGETLAERIARGPLSVALAVRYASDIAEALYAAHRHGIVHRDLKPGNVMIAPSGVKLLDFGLAKAASARPAALSALDTAAAATGLTSVGTIAGTFQYMAPEQLEGRAADERTDIFALGLVIYEMVTARRPFVGNSPMALASAILHGEPAPLSGPAATVPPVLERVVRICLDKDPDRRWQSAHDVALQLSLPDDAPRDAASPASDLSRKRLVRAWPWAVTAAALSLTLVVATRGRPAGPSAPSVTFQVGPPAGGRFPDTVETVPFAVSPDGLQLAMVVREGDERSRVWVRPLSSLDMRPLAGTDGAEGVFWSPDSQALGFFAGAKLKRVDVQGSAVVPLCDVREGVGQTGSWGRDGQILFAPIDGSAIYRTSTAGEAAVVERASDGGEAARVRWPSFLRDGRYLYAAQSARGTWTLMLAAQGQQPRAIGQMASTALYVEPGYLLFTREGTLLGQRFDAAAGRTSGEPFSIASPIRYFASNGWSPFSASVRGTLVYQAQGGVQKIVSYDRSGRELATLGTPAENARLHLSADGKVAMFDRVRPGLGTIDVWSVDLARAVETRLTSDAGTEAAPVAVAGARMVVFASTKRGGLPNLVRKDLDTGVEEFLMPPATMQMVEDVSSDGTTILFSQRSTDGNFDLWTIPTTGAAAPSIFMKSVVDQQSARFSPDGRFVAFMSTESGRAEIYLARFRPRGEAIRVSTIGGRAPRWSRDTHELFFLSADRQLIAVPVRTEPELQLGQPQPQSAVSAGRRWSTFDVTPDGRKFLAIVPEALAGEQPLTVIVNRIPAVPE